MDRKWNSLQTLLIVGAVFVGIVVLLRLMLARSQTVVQQPQGNPWVALIDAAPGLVTSVGGLVGGIFSKDDGAPSGITEDVVKFVDDIPQDRVST
jgi:hypothetical protein